MRDPGYNTVTADPSPGQPAFAVPPPFDALADPQVEDLLPAAVNFWPSGAAFGTPDAAAPDLDSNWSRLMRALLAPFVALYRRAFLLARESSPALLDRMLGDWEREYGLPDACVTGEQSRAERLAFLAARVNAMPSITPGDFVRLAADYGFSVEIEEPALFECGFSECAGEHAAGDAAQEIYWIVRVADVAIYFFTAGEGEVAGDPLFSLGEASLLLCIFKRLAPAWTIPVLELPE